MRGGGADGFEEGAGRGGACRGGAVVLRLPFGEEENDREGGDDRGKQEGGSGWVERRWAGL